MTHYTSPFSRLIEASSSQGTPVTPADIAQPAVEAVQEVSTYLDSLASGQPAFIATTISIGLRILSAILILGAGWLIGNWFRKRLSSIKIMDPTLGHFFGGLVKYILVSISVITVISLFGIPMASLVALLGAAGLAIGLALQGTLSNVAAGVMILVLRPFKVGDYITFGSEGGTVKSLGLFGTELSMPDNVYVFAPNSKIWGNEIRNFSRNPTRRQDILVGISYRDDIQKAMDAIHAVLAADSRILKEPQDMAPQVLVDKMADFSVDLIVRFWSAGSEYWNLRWDITKAVKETLDAHGITIPFPTRTIEMISTSSALIDS